MSEDQASYNPLTLRDDLATLLAIEPALAQQICRAVAQVVARGFGRVEITITHHQVRCLYTTFSEPLD